MILSYYKKLTMLNQKNACIMQQRKIKHKHGSWIHANNSNFEVIDIHFLFLFQYLFECVCGIFVTLNYFTICKDITVKGCKFSLLPGIHGHWQVRIFSVPRLLWHGRSVYMVISEEPHTPTFFVANRSWVVTTCLNPI